MWDGKPRVGETYERLICEGGRAPKETGTRANLISEGKGGLNEFKARGEDDDALEKGMGNDGSLLSGRDWRLVVARPGSNTIGSVGGMRTFGGASRNVIRSSR